jgi:hypothetical protein
MRPLAWFALLLGLAALALFLWWGSDASGRGERGDYGARDRAGATSSGEANKSESRAGGSADADSANEQGTDGAFTNSDDDAESNSPLTGRVIAGDKGVANARVWVVADTRVAEDVLAPSAPSLEQTYSDADGRFSFDVPANRAYIIYAQARGFALGARSVEANDRDCTIDIPSQARRRTFRLVDIEEKPVPGAIVRVVKGMHITAALETVHADVDGTFTVTIFYNARLVLSAPGFATASVQADRDSETIVMTVGASIAGIVVDAAGAPIKGVVVIHDRPFSADDLVRTDAEGRFRFNGAELETQTLLVLRNGEQVLATSVEPGDESVRLVVAETSERTGVVVFEDGRPAPRVPVEGEVTDARGRFVFRVPPLRALVTAELGSLPGLPGEPSPPSEWYGYAILSDDVRKPVRIVLQHQTRSYVRVRFVDGSGLGLPGIVLGGLPCQESDKDGRAVTAFIVPAGTTVRPRPRVGGYPYPFEAKTHADLASAPEQTVHVRPTARATLVVRLPNGDPLPQDLNARIELSFARVIKKQHDRALFEFDRTNSGYPRFHVTVSAVGFIATSRGLPLPKEDTEVEVRLVRGHEVVGRLLDRDGTPTAGWVLFRANRMRPVFAEIGSDGRFKLAGVGPGKGSFQFGQRENEVLLAVDRVVEAARTDVGDIRLLPTRILEGSVSGDGPLGGAVVRFAHRHHDAVTATSADGTFRLRVLPGLKADLQVSKPGWGAVVVPATPNQQIVLRRAGRVRLVAKRAVPSDPRVKSYSFGVRLPGGTTELPVRVVSRAGRERIFADVPAGPVEVFVSTIIGERTVRVNVQSGQTVDAELTVP